MKWYENAVFYALPTLQALGAEEHNDFCSPARHRIKRLVELIPHIKALGCTAINLGPVNESSGHGYDTVDHFHIDRRLGNNESFRETVAAFHEAGLKVIVDTVFNHTGRDHWAFYDLRMNKQASAYRDWFAGVDFSRDNGYGDRFSYKNWEGHDSLVTLNRANPAVREHLMSHIKQLIHEHGVDGVRLDVAYSLESDFLAHMAALARRERDDFYLMGEIIHGDYNRLLHEGSLDSVTNYEASKGLWSSLNDTNYFEIAWTLEREFGHGGLYRGKALYNFVDNHDANRVHSLLKDKRHIHLVYAMLFCLPGTPALYYGSEFRADGIRDNHSDRALRPHWDDIPKAQENLVDFLSTLSRFRRERPFLARAVYRKLQLENSLFAFALEEGGKQIVAVFNQADSPRPLALTVPRDGRAASGYRDILGQRPIPQYPDGRLDLHLEARSFLLLEPAGA